MLRAAAPTNRLSLTRRRRERGSVALLAAVAILVLVGMMVLAVDLGYLLGVRGQLQNGVDAAALAAAAGLRASVQPTGSAFGTQQEVIVRDLAKDFAARNSLRLASQVTPITLDNSDITYDPADPRRVVVKHRVTAPTVFATLFGQEAINISAGAVGAVVAVDGATGAVSGCWRPILLPDTFFDASNQVWAVGGRPAFLQQYWGAVRFGAELPNQPGDYYRSRFAALSGPRSGYPFVAQVNSLGPAVTGVRDTQTAADLKENNGSNLIASPINFRPPAVNLSRLGDYRVVNFEASGLGSVSPTGVYSQALKGACLNLQVGQQLRVYAPTDLSAYEQLSYGLADLHYNSSSGDQINQTLFQSHRYVKSTLYPTPNTHPRIIPVLLFNPFELVNNPNASTLTVTNIGALYLDLAGSGNPNIYGYFVREVAIGGRPLQAANAVAPANVPLLPVAVQLSR
jgi:hypothetical protein